MFRSSSPLLRKSEPPVQVQDTIITAWTIRHPTRNRNDPIARAELYQLSYIGASALTIIAKLRAFVQPFFEKPVNTPDSSYDMQSYIDSQEKR